MNLHLRIIYIFLRTWSVANRMVKGDRLRYDTIAAIYFLITYKTGGGGGEKRHLVDLRSKRKVKRIEYIPNTGAYIYIYIYIHGCLLSRQFAIIAISFV